MLYKYEIITGECSFCCKEKCVFSEKYQDVLICRKCAQEIADVLAGKRPIEAKE